MTLAVCRSLILARQLNVTYYYTPGVVDARLKVYGTTNVRVVDASIIPMQISAHLSAPLYGIAEKAAAMIAEDA